MSQIYKAVGGGGSPAVPTSFTTDFQANQTTPVGTAVPVLNNLKILGGSGIETYVDPNGGQNVYIKVKNSTTNSTGQTINVQTITLSTISCATAGTYFFTSQIAAYTTTGPAGAGGQLYTTVISDGVTATVIDDTDSIAHRSASLVDIDYAITASGTNAILTVTGVEGLTIDWGSITIYVYRG